MVMLQMLKKMNLLKRLLNDKWLVMVAGIYLTASGGAIYDFSVYSQAIKSSLRLDQKQLNTISFSAEVGDSAGFVAGLLYDVWPVPVVSIGVGALLNLAGYLMAWLALTRRFLSNVRVWHLCLFLALGSNAQTFPETAVMVVTLRNFPNNGGTALGLIKAFYGLSGAILPQLYLALFSNRPTSFLLLAAVLPSLVSLLCMFLVRYVPNNHTPPHLTAKIDRRAMRLLYGITLALAMYLMVILVVENVVPSLSRLLVATLTALMIAIMCLPLLVVMWSCFSKLRPEYIVPTWIHPQWKADHAGAKHPNTTIDKEVELPKQDPAPKAVVLPMDNSKEHAKIPDVNHTCNQESHPSATYNASLVSVKGWLQAYILPTSNPQRGEDHSIAQALLSLDFWVLFIALTCGLGASSVFLNNMAQVGYSQNYSTIQINTMVSLVNTWNFFGRIVAGPLSDTRMSGRAKYPFLSSRPALLSISIAVLVVASLLIAFGIKGALYIGSALFGLSIGAQYTLIAVIMSDLFGLKNLGTLYFAVACAGPLGQYVLSIRVAGALYDKQASKQNNGTIRSGQDVICTGIKCFQSTFLIMTGVTALGTLVCIVLTRRTMKYYKRKTLYQNSELFDEQPPLQT